MSLQQVLLQLAYSVLLFLGGAVLLLPLAHAEEETFQLCTSADINAACTAQSRTCLKIIPDNDAAADGSNVTEFCDQCLAGTIPNFTSSDQECIPIDSITFEDYENAFDLTLEENLSGEVRLNLLKDIAQRISVHNAQFPPPDFYVALNHLSALSQNEIQKRNGYRSDNEAEEDIPFLEDLQKDQERRLQSIPKSVNWVEAGAVTDIVNQEQCGCCWSISTVGAVEGIAAIRSNYSYLQSLSFQQLISCYKGNQGCDGGSVTGAMQYVEEDTNTQYTIGGLTTDELYPFVDAAGTTTTTCTVDNDQLAVQVNGATRMVTKTSSTANSSQRILDMKTAVAKQPLSVLIKATCPTFQSYSGGVMTSDGTCSCSPSISNCLDHAVLLVGYDDTASIPYWYLKNSWGTGWGDQGYFYIAQAATTEWGLFGVLAQGTIPTDAFNTTAEVDTSGAVNLRDFPTSIPAVISFFSGLVLGLLG